jgi:hypothetical protein
MDPFLEAHWGDVHTSITLYARNQLRPRLPSDLRARVEEYHTLEVLDEDDESERSVPRRVKPDVRIVEVMQSKPESHPGIAIQPSPCVEVSLEPETHRRIVITESKTERLVTAIEFLSRSNKFGKSREMFLDKQYSLWHSGVNVVEIDLLREGAWSLSCDEDLSPAQCRYPYRVFVKPERNWSARFYPTSIREPLPIIEIPLRDGDSPVLLELQPLVTMAWEDGEYSDIDYGRDPLPSFTEDDLHWIEDLLAAYGAPRV